MSNVRIGASKAALMGAREGNVAPLTPLDRHTGRAALGASKTEACIELASSRASEVTAQATQRPAGSREEKWRAPLEGSGEGSATADAPQAPEGMESAPVAESALFRSYSETKCSSQGPALDRPTWLRGIARRTKRFRAARALRSRGKARLALDAGNLSRAAWHLARAKGQVERFERVDLCGEREILSRCEDCGHEARKIEARCSHFRLCLKCRGHRAARYRAMIRVGRRRALQKTAHLHRAGAPGGRWGERFLTLSLPHSGDVVRDLQILPLAWKSLRNALWRFFAKDCGLDRNLLSFISFVRVIEVTPGTHGEGHAHLHVYMICPFIPHELVRHLWGRALREQGYQPPTRPLSEVLDEARSPRARTQLERLLVTRRGPKGRPLSEVDWPVVDLRACHGDVERELVKYLVKDAELEQGKLNLVDPELYASIYEGLEGVRTVATSRHFFIREDRACACEQCGSTRVSTRAVNKAGAPALEGGELP